MCDSLLQRQPLSTLWLLPIHTPKDATVLVVLYATMKLSTISMANASQGLGDGSSSSTLLWFGETGVGVVGVVLSSGSESQPRVATVSIEGISCFLISDLFLLW